MIDTIPADGTVCDSCGRVLVPGDLVAYMVDPPGSIAVCSNPPCCAECVTSWTVGVDGPETSWVQCLIKDLCSDGSSIEWVLVVEEKKGE